MKQFKNAWLIRGFEIISFAVQLIDSCIYPLVLVVILTFPLHWDKDKLVSTCLVVGLFLPLPLPQVTYRTELGSNNRCRVVFFGGGGWMYFKITVIDKY